MLERVSSPPERRASADRGVPGLARRRSRSRRPRRRSAGRSTASSSPRPRAERPRRDARLQTRHGDVRDRARLFCNFLLADEINRAPAKVQSALLERAGAPGHDQARHVAGAGPFLVMATQGDRVRGRAFRCPRRRSTGSCSRSSSAISPRGRVDGRGAGARPPRRGAAGRDVGAACRAACARGTRLRRPCGVALCRRDGGATRSPDAAGIEEIGRHVEFGASPRGSIALVVAARAWLIRGRDYVLPQDLADLAHDVLRHRLVLSYEAIATDVAADALIDAALAAVPRRRSSRGARGAGARFRPSRRRPTVPARGPVTPASCVRSISRVARRTAGLVDGEHRATRLGRGSEARQVRPGRTATTCAASTGTPPRVTASSTCGWTWGARRVDVAPARRVAVDGIRHGHAPQGRRRRGSGSLWRTSPHGGETGSAPSRSAAKIRSPFHSGRVEDSSELCWRRARNQVGRSARRRSVRRSNVRARSRASAASSSSCPTSLAPALALARVAGSGARGDRDRGTGPPRARAPGRGSPVARRPRDRPADPGGHPARKTRSAFAAVASADRADVARGSRRSGWRTAC